MLAEALTVLAALTKPCLFNAVARTNHRQVTQQPIATPDTPIAALLHCCSSICSTTAAQCLLKRPSASTYYKRTPTQPGQVLLVVPVVLSVRCLPYPTPHHALGCSVVPVPHEGWTPLPNIPPSPWLFSGGCGAWRVDPHPHPAHIPPSPWLFSDLVVLGG